MSFCLRYEKQHYNNCCCCCSAALYSKWEEKVGLAFNTLKGSGSCLSKTKKRWLRSHNFPHLAAVVVAGFSLERLRASSIKLIHQLDSKPKLSKSFAFKFESWLHSLRLAVNLLPAPYQHLCRHPSPAKWYDGRSAIWRPTRYWALVMFRREATLKWWERKKERKKSNFFFPPSSSFSRTISSIATRPKPTSIRWPRSGPLNIDETAQPKTHPFLVCNPRFDIPRTITQLQRKRCIKSECPNSCRVSSGSRPFHLLWEFGTLQLGCQSSPRPKDESCFLSMGT